MERLIMGRALPEEVPAVFGLYEKRIGWMEEKGLRQWNRTGYLSFYDAAYFGTQQSQGRLYVLREGGRVIGAAVLLEQDSRWPEMRDPDAYYVHNLAADPEYPGAGAALLSQIEALAAERGKTFVRLDCAAGNAVLNRYYEVRGYRLAGRCEAGGYFGNRREKRLPGQADRL